ncbi:MAG: helix-turn-helix transcriptional regulator [Bacteroidales bacterium]|nr:helix-turn-helix transcriptional regulator [Bacteroidales bacterium]
MSLLYVDEHVSCCNFAAAYKNGFKYFQLAKGQDMILPDNKFNRILFVLAGEATLRVDSIEYAVTKEEISFLKLHEQYKVTAVTDIDIIVNYFEQTIDLCAAFSMDKLLSYVDSEQTKTPTLKPNPMLETFLTSLVFYLGSGANCKYLHEVKQKELFFIFRFFYTKEALAAFFTPVICNNFDFKKAVLDNYRKIGSVKELAVICNCSMTSFLRQFKATFNEQPLAWLQDQRLQAVTKMLSKQSIPFCQIIDEFGFSAPSHFTVFCKKHLGMTPTQYRKYATEQAEEAGTK